MKDALRDEASRIVNHVREFYALQPLYLSGQSLSPYEETYCLLMAIRNDALEEAASLMQDIVFVSGLPKDEAHNSMERAEAILKLKVNP